MNVLFTCVVAYREKDWRRRVEDKVRRDRDLNDDDILYSGVADSVDSDTCDGVCAESCICVSRIVNIIYRRTYQQYRQLTQTLQRHRNASPLQMQKQHIDR